MVRKSSKAAALPPLTNAPVGEASLLMLMLLAGSANVAGGGGFTLKPSVHTHQVAYLASISRTSVP